MNRTLLFWQQHPIEGADSLVHISEEDAIKHMKKVYKEKGFSYEQLPDEEILLDFIAVNWAFFKEENND